MGTLYFLPSITPGVVVALIAGLISFLVSRAISRPIEDIKREVERLMGGPPAKAEVTDEPVAVVKWVDGTVMDTVWRVGRGAIPDTTTRSHWCPRIDERKPLGPLRLVCRERLVG